MLSFEYNTKNDTLEVFFDVEGKAQLIKLIERIAKPGDHDHLMTPSWSGHELSAVVHTEGNTLINMVTFGMPKKRD